MAHCEIQIKKDGKWDRFMNWWGMKKGYGTGAFRMLVGFSTGERYRLIDSAGIVLEEKQAPSTPTTNN
jgi:hypothetical protein